MYALVLGRSYPQPNTGMMGIFEFEQAVALNNHGMNSVYSFCDTRSIKRLRKLNFTSFISNNVPVYGYHFPIGGLPKPIFDTLKTNRNKKTLDKIIKNHGIPDIIHVHFPLLNLNTKIWQTLKALNRPIVITEHWTKVQTKTIEPYRVELLKQIVEEADTFICVGNLLKESIIELTATTREIKVIPNMVKPVFTYEEQAKSEKFDFITIGRLVDIKRFDLVVEAFANAFKNIQQVSLHIVGNGPQYNQLKDRIQALDMADQIKLHGFLPREETAKLLKKSDAFVSASILETFGVPFIEAMSCGKPVIGAANGPIDNYILDNSGTLFEADNLEDLTSSMESVYLNRDEYNGKQIAEKAKKNFSEKAIANQLITIYCKLF